MDRARSIRGRGQSADNLFPDRRIFQAAAFESYPHIAPVLAPGRNLHSAYIQRKLVQKRFVAHKSTISVVPARDTNPGESNNTRMDLTSTLVFRTVRSKGEGQLIDDILPSISV